MISNLIKHSAVKYTGKSVVPSLPWVFRLFFLNFDLKLPENNLIWYVCLSGSLLDYGSNLYSVYGMRRRQTCLITDSLHFGQAERWFIVKKNSSRIQDSANQLFYRKIKLTWKHRVGKQIGSRVSLERVACIHKLHWVLFYFVMKSPWIKKKQLNYWTSILLSVISVAIRPHDFTQPNAFLDYQTDRQQQGQY